MEDYLEQIKTKSVKGVLSLTSRTAVLQVINFGVGYLFATIFLKRAEFGIFIIISTIIDILGYFSDVGLAAALVQKKKDISIKEIRSTFTIQQLLVSSIIILLLIFSPLIKRFYHLEPQAMFLLYSFALAFFLSSLKTIPSVILERKLEFNKLIIPQFVETIIFNLILIVMLWRGYGLLSYSLAVLVRGFLGTITLYFLCPWPIGINFSFKILKKLFRYGLPFQLNSLLAVIKDKFMILLLGRIIGTEGIGVLGWAEKWATMPLRYFLDNTVKVAFSTFSRLQHDKHKLTLAIEKSFYFLAFILLPSLAGVGLIASSLIKIIPRWGKWEAGMLPLYFYCGASIFGSLAVFLTTIFNSLGKIKTTFKLMIFWTLLSCFFVPLLALKFGITGAALGVFIVNFTAVVGLVIMRKWLQIKWLFLLKGPLLSALGMMIVTFYLKRYFPVNLMGLVLIVLTGILSYSISFLLIDRKRFMKEAVYLLEQLKKKQLIKNEN